ncbi:hypothetical protein KFE25_001842 [Diacronema lutheri]|uniref:Uncharacterized protein n=1 Tax=Diacronema lutheri TaxID=2081491 RepID=A0A8J5XLW8_DIALT|nr:hypothetical protein KFE25_001842 [Diacronema lutheri]
MWLPLTVAAVFACACAPCAHAWHGSAGAVPRSSRLAARTRVVLQEVSDGDLSKEFSDLVLKMPRLIDPQRASYEAWRERRAKAAKDSRKSSVVRFEEVDLDDPQTEPRPLDRAPEEKRATPIDFEVDLAAYADGEDAYVVEDIDAENNNAADDYLGSL